MSGLSRRAIAVLVVALALTAPLAVATVAAHGDHVAADSQAIDDGTVVVETVSSLRPGFVVLRADAGGRPGEPLGSAYVGRTPGLTFLTSVPVSVDESVWAEWDGNRTVWAVLHGDTDGDEEFDYGTDRSLTSVNPAASTSFTVRKSEGGRAAVLAAAFDAQPMDEGTITVRRADLPADGHLVVRPPGRERVAGRHPPQRHGRAERLVRRRAVERLSGPDRRLPRRRRRRLRPRRPTDHRRRPLRADVSDRRARGRRRRRPPDQHADSDDRTRILARRLADGRSAGERHGRPDEYTHGRSVDRSGRHHYRVGQRLRWRRRRARGRRRGTRGRRRSLAAALKRPKTGTGTDRDRRKLTAGVRGSRRRP